MEFQQEYTMAETLVPEVSEPTQTEPRFKLNTTYSFGIDDQISPYTLKDTPIFTCIRMTPEDMLARLG
jgi:chlorite dismutase